MIKAVEPDVAQKITERPSGEEAAQASQALLAGILTSATDAIISVDAEQCIVLFNPAAEHMFGWAATEITGHPLDLLIPSRFRHGHEHHIRDFGATGVTTRALGALGALSGLRRDGTEFPVEASISQVEIAGQKLYTVILRDITQRQAAAAALAQSEHRFRALVENSLEAIALFSAEGTILYGSASTTAVLGYPLDDFVGHNAFEFIHPDDQERVTNCLTIALQRPGTHVPVVARVQHHNGTWRWLEGVFTNLLADPSIQAIVNNYRDVTESKGVEEQLQYQASLIQNVSDAIISTDLNYEVESWNQAAEALYGWRLDEVRGKATLDILHTQYGHNGREEALQTIRERGTWRGEVIQTRKDGTPIHVLASVTVLKDPGGKQIGTVAVNRDITERKREEERQAFLAQASAVLAESLDYETTLAAVAHLAVPRLADWCTIHLVGEDGTLDQVALVHADPAKVQWAQEFQRRSPPDPNATRGVAQVVRSGQAEFIPDIPHELIRAQIHDPEILQILDELALRSAMTVPLIVRGRTLGAIAFASTQAKHPYTLADLALAEELARRAALAVDNARLYRAAQQLNEELEQRVSARTAQLEVVNQELEAFSYSVSHDLRAPLSHILGFIELLQMNIAATLDGTNARYLTIVAEAAERMGTLIDDLLAFSRVGQAELKKSDFLLGPLVQEVISDCGRETRDRQITWQIAALPEAHADRALLRLVWTNLITNALKYSRTRQQAEIEIGYWREVEETVFFIRDNGVGFDMKYVDKLFGVFQRLHSATRFEGTGIGLANVRRIINRHGGRTWAEGAVERGATFYFSLPNAEES